MAQHEPSETTVLVTGASGFIGLHCVRELLQKGYRVRGTVRSLAREPTLRDALEKHADTTNFELVTADLMSDEGWAEAMRGCRYLWHVASPVPNAPPKHEDDLIIPARDGTLRVLRAASEAGVERVVLTSSIAAVCEGYPRDPSRVFNEDDWSRLEGDVSAYDKSKTLAERAAWDFVGGLAGDNTLELATINPGLVLGPVLEQDYGVSPQAILKLMRRDYPGCPRLGWPIVDVRDVASAHLAAMITPEAKGQRFCCCVDFVWMKEIAAILTANFGDRGYELPTRTLPDFVVRIAGLFDKVTRVVTPRLGLELNVSSERIRRVLGWQPRGTEEMIVATGESLIELGIV
ncbi:MAG: aldehyde reductase [Myxococcales bacterium]|nr:aldehyde reductase [Myxococcales bacterium]MDH3486331.1 aldehyde reductase [Myxococcales bacterium]